MVQNFHEKLSQILGDFCAHLKSIIFYIKTAVATFCATFAKKIGELLFQHLVTRLHQKSYLNGAYLSGANCHF